MTNFPHMSGKQPRPRPIPPDLVEKCESLLMQLRLFSIILRTIRPKICLLTCFYHDQAMALLSACHRAGITSVELQHGIIDKEDSFYGRWTKVPVDGFEMLPAYILTWVKPRPRLNLWRRTVRGNISRW